MGLMGFHELIGVLVVILEIRVVVQLVVVLLVVVVVVTLEIRVVVQLVVVLLVLVVVVTIGFVLVQPVLVQSRNLAAQQITPVDR